MWSVKGAQERFVEGRGYAHESLKLCFPRMLLVALFFLAWLCLNQSL